MFNIEQIPDKKKCRKMVETIILGNKCPRCKKRLYKSTKYYWCGNCRKKIYPKSLTWLKHSKISYQKIIVLVYCWQKKIDPGAIKKLLGLSYPTIARWYRKFRVNLPRDNDLLCGVVEVDEAFFGRLRFNNQKIVIGAIERKTKKIKLREIPDREQDSIEIFIDKHISTASHLHTDCHSSYFQVMDMGYWHSIHNHSQGHFKDTNRIENVWSVVKRQIRRMYGQIRTKKLNEFIIEWEARWNFPKLFDNPFNYLQATLVRC